MQIVTTFGPAGYEVYARRFLEQLVEHLGPDIDVVAYHEEPCALPERVEGRDLNAVEPCRAFLERYTPLAWAHGLEVSSRWTGKERAAGYSFRFDAFKFARKVFAVQDAAHRTTRARLYWIDADVLVSGRIDREFLASVLPDPFAMCFLDRPRNYTECGFIGYHLVVPGVREFIDAFAGEYSDGTFSQHREWHDSWVFDRVRETVAFREFKIQSAGSSQPFDHSVLGSRMRHLKGKRKYRRVEG